MLPEALREDTVLVELDRQLGAGLIETKESLGDLVIVVEPASLLEASNALKHSAGFERLSSVTAVDWWPKKPRFEVVYHLHSIRHNRRLRMKAAVEEGAEIDSVTSVWTTANWYEREVFDLFGIPFRNHPFLERIMMPVDWEGHPLRKDYPVHGYKYSYAEQE